MTVIIVNREVPLWVKRGQKRPPQWLRDWFPNRWEKELMTYGKPGEIGKYFAEKSMKRIVKHLKLEVENNEVP